MALRDDSVKSFVLRALSAGAGEDGFGHWMTIVDLVGGNQSVSCKQVHKRIYELYRDGAVQARDNPGAKGRNLSQQYRVVPHGDEGPLYVPKQGADTRLLAVMFDGYTYTTPVTDEERAAAVLSDQPGENESWQA